jgi:hypothetical protein
VGFDTVDNIRYADDPAERQFDLRQIDTELSRDVSEGVNARSQRSVNKHWSTIACSPRSVFDVLDPANNQCGPRLADADYLADGCHAGGHFKSRLKCSVRSFAPFPRHLSELNTLIFQLVNRKFAKHLQELEKLAGRAKSASRWAISPPLRHPAEMLSAADKLSPLTSHAFSLAASVEVSVILRLLPARAKSVDHGPCPPRGRKTRALTSTLTCSMSEQS